MRTSCINNSLAVAIILLFVGVGIQPAFAVTSNTTESEDDCDICSKASKQYIDRLTTLLDRLEKHNNQLSVLSKHNPEVEEKYQKLSKKIAIFKEMNKELNLDWNFPIICTILSIIFVLTLTPLNIWFTIYVLFGDYSLIPIILGLFLIIPWLLCFSSFWLLIKLDCIDFYPYYFKFIER